MKGDLRTAPLNYRLFQLRRPIYAPPGKSVVVLHSYSDINIWPKIRPNTDEKD